MKKLLVLLLAAGAAFFAWDRHNGAPAPGPSYRRIQVERGDVSRTVLATGVVEPQNRLEIKPPIAGRVEQVLAEEGKLLERGEVLAWMSSTERAALLDAARAQGPEALARWEGLYKPIPVVAPLSGTLIARKVEPGQTVAAQDVMLVMSDMLIVKAQVDETDIAQINLEQPARVSLDAFASETIQGKVTHVAFEAETVNNVTIYRVDVLPSEIPAFMRSGMTADVTFVVAEKRGVPRLPAEALVTEDGKSFVLRGSAEGKPPRRHEVELGLSDGAFSEVIKGLSEGDEVLVPEIIALPESKKEVSNPFMPGRPGGGRRGGGR